MFQTTNQIYQWVIFLMSPQPPAARLQLTVHQLLSRHAPVSRGVAMAKLTTHKYVAIKANLPEFEHSGLSLPQFWLVGGWATPLKNISQLRWLFPIYGKMKNVPNHQPVGIWRYIIPQLQSAKKSLSATLVTFTESMAGNHISRIELLAWSKKHILSDNQTWQWKSPPISTDLERSFCGWYSDVPNLGAS